MWLLLSIIEIEYLKEINIFYLKNKITAADEINTLWKFFIFWKTFQKRFYYVPSKLLE